MSDDEGAVNVGVVCGKVFHDGTPVEAHVSLMSITVGDQVQSVWSKIRGHVGAVYSNAAGEYAINFYWDATEPLMMAAHFNLRAIHRHLSAVGGVAHGIFHERVSMAALSEVFFDAFMTKTLLAPFKIKKFLSVARKGVSAFKRSTTAAEFTPELYAIVGVSDIHLSSTR